MLASYESAESRTKAILRKMKSAVKRKVRGHRGGTAKDPPRLTAEWGEVMHNDILSTKGMDQWVVCCFSVGCDELQMLQPQSS